jgi:hypothetical protein
MSTQNGETTLFCRKFPADARTDFGMLSTEIEYAVFGTKFHLHGRARLPPSRCIASQFQLVATLAS